MAYRDRSRKERALDPNLTPLLDVVLQLITFFMMLIHFGSKIEGASKSIRLPSASAALPGGDLPLDRLVVSLDDRGGLLVENTRFDESSWETWWTDQARSRRAGQAILKGKPENELATLVVVRADKDASYGAVRRLLGVAQSKGFANFSLVVLRAKEVRP